MIWRNSLFYLLTGATGLEGLWESQKLRASCCIAPVGKWQAFMRLHVMGQKLKYMGDCQNYGPFLGPLNWAPYYNRDPKRDHNFDSPPYIYIHIHSMFCRKALFRKTLIPKPR